MRYIKIFEEFTNDNILYNWITLTRGDGTDKASNPESIDRLEKLLIYGIKFGKNDGGGLDNDRWNKKNEKYPYCISTTRNKRWRWGPNEIRVTLNKQKIENSFKIEPIQYAASYSTFYNGNKDGTYKHEFEERIYSKKDKYLGTNCIIKIEATKKIFDVLSKLKNPNNIELVLNDNLVNDTLASARG